MSKKVLNNKALNELKHTYKDKVYSVFYKDVDCDFGGSFENRDYQNIPAFKDIYFIMLGKKLIKNTTIITDIDKEINEPSPFSPIINRY